MTYVANKTVLITGADVGIQDAKHYQVRDVERAIEMVTDEKE